jgi:hypothetical protein
MVSLYLLFQCFLKGSFAPLAIVAPRLLFSPCIELWYSKKIVQMILHFQKEINVIMYIIEKTFKLNFNHLPHVT